VELNEKAHTLTHRLRNGPHQTQGMNMINETRELNDAELDLVAGGVRDNPQSDYYNALQAARNGADGTFGGSLGGVIPGLVTAGSGPGTPGHPV
jgi:hypothetical protein